ncbi:doublecortin domain-containing protein 2 [Biomphalaria glabrata]|nr:doublecortin domain-containing protein 2-like [Biomphalaria glabrata]
MTTMDSPHKDMDYYTGPDKSDRGYAADHSEHSEPDESKHKNDINRGLAANFFINGDVFFTAKRVVYNPKHFKDMSHYLDYLTDRIAPRFGAVRKIHTPKYGHRISELKELKENASYVVAGNERFKTYPRENENEPRVKANETQIYLNLWPCSVTKPQSQYKAEPLLTFNMSRLKEWDKLGHIVENKYQ